MNNPDFSFLFERQENSLTMIVSSLFIGVIIACVAMLYHQLFLGGIVRRIIEKKAYSPEDALTVEQLGYSNKNIFIKFALRQNSTFRKTVHSPEDQPDRYYIPESIRMREEIRFRSKGNSVFGILLAVLVFLVVAYVSLTVVPWFIDSLNDIIS